MLNFICVVYGKNINKHVLYSKRSNTFQRYLKNCTIAYQNQYKNLYYLFRLKSAK